MTVILEMTRDFEFDVLVCRSRQLKNPNGQDFATQGRKGKNLAECRSHGVRSAERKFFPTLDMQKVELKEIYLSFEVAGPGR